MLEVRLDEAEFDLILNVGGGHLTFQSYNALGDIEEVDAAGRRIRGNAFDNHFDFRGVQLISVDSIRGDDGNDTILASTETHDVT